MIVEKEAERLKQSENLALHQLVGFYKVAAKHSP
jgi:hypothetical protein